MRHFDITNILIVSGFHLLGVTFTLPAAFIAERVIATAISDDSFALFIARATFIPPMSIPNIDQPAENYTLTFLGFGEESDTCVLELTYNYGITDYTMGNAYGHIAISVDNCHTACRDIKAKGGDVNYAATALANSNEIIAFVVDPDGYQIELIQRPVICNRTLI